MISYIIRCIRYCKIAERRSALGVQIFIQSISSNLFYFSTYITYYNTGRYIPSENETQQL